MIYIFTIDFIFMDIFFTNPVDALQKCRVLVAGVFENNKLFGRLSVIDQQSHNFLSNALNSSTFKGKFCESFTIATPQIIDDYNNINHIIFIGLGKQSDLDDAKAPELGAAIADVANHSKFEEITVLLEAVREEHIAHCAFGALVKDYRFEKYKTKLSDNDENEDNSKHTIKSITLVAENDDYTRKLFVSKLDPIRKGMELARNLVTEPGNVLYPESYANIIKDLTKEFSDLKVEVLDEKMMQKLQMNALLGVGQGSQYPSRLVVMKWDGAENKDEKPIVLVGKGVTFDTGGVSLKPAKGMWNMIYDMAGSAAVVGTMYSLAAQKMKKNVVGIVGLVENAISGTAQRPGDIVKSMSGQTIEVLNTDAEGRLVLADALWYAQEKFQPECIVDLATLTGAVVVALGHNYAGLFSNNDDLSAKLTKAGDAVNEKLWRFPLSKDYDKLIDSPVADMKNISTKGYGADSITAAQFLQRFIKDSSTPWAHLDIAGVAWDKVNCKLRPKGASGFGVMLLNKFISEYSTE